jgi:hypothetical protein
MWRLRDGMGMMDVVMLCDGGEVEGSEGGEE